MSYQKKVTAGLLVILNLYCHVVCEDRGFCNGFDTETVTNSDHDGYNLHSALEGGLAKGRTNLYNIQKARLQSKSESRIACLLATFVLECEPQNFTDTNSEQCTDINGTRIEFLWSSFYTNTALGDILLKYTMYDLRVFGFEWEDNCELYQNTVTLNIVVDKINANRSDLCVALQYITTLLPAYSTAQNISNKAEELSIGYARSWPVDSQHQHQKWKSHPYVMLVTIFILIISKIVIVSLFTTYYDDLIEHFRWKNSAFYFLFWGCHFTVIGFITVQVIFLIRTQKNRLIPLVSLGLSALIDLLMSIFAPIVCKKAQRDMLPVPLSSCMEQTGKVFESIYLYVLNVVAFFLSFIFISYILQTIPNFLISYYAFPTETLIHLAFFQVAFVCLVVAFAGTLILVEKCACLCYIKKTGMLPKELMNFTHEQTVQPTHEILNIHGVTTESIQSEDHSTQPNNLSQNAYVVIESTSGVARLKYPEKFKFTIMKVACQIFTALIGTTALILLLITVGVIIFSDTVPKDNFQGILTLLPTIAVDVVIIVTRNRVFGNIKGLLSDIVEGENDHHSSRTNAPDPGEGSSRNAPPTEVTPLLTEHHDDLRQETN